MKIRLVKIKGLSGNKSTFYSVYYNKDTDTLFEQFLKKNIDLLKSETINIYNRLMTIGHEVGARDGFFTPEEGIPGDMVCALYDRPGRNLRLYCIRYSEKLVILGSGGIKPKKISALQDDPILKLENNRVVQIAKLIQLRTDEGEIFISWNGHSFEGEIELKDDYYED